MRLPKTTTRLPLALALTVTACAQEASPDVAEGAEQEALQQQGADPAAPGVPNLVGPGTSDRVFAFNLYRQLAKENPGANLVFSPYSISNALALTYVGARGATASELKSTLNFELPDEAQHKAYADARVALASRGKDQVGADGTPFRLNVSNALWVQSGLQLEQPFLDVAASSYGAKPTGVDFAKDVEAARATINAQVAKDTENLVPELLARDDLSPVARLVITNTVYFNASWQTKFDPKQTREAPFTRLDGSKVNAQLMTKQLTVPYARRPGLQAVALPYASADLSFLAVLPDEGKFAEVEAEVSQHWLDGVRALLKPTTLEVSVPKLDYRAKASLPKTLTALGLKTPFTDAADFSGITRERLQISDVVHEAVIKVFEGGTIAAAATGVVIAPTSARPAETKLHLDRPFLYAVLDRPTGQLLFLGRVADPTAR